MSALDARNALFGLIITTDLLQLNPVTYVDRQISINLVNQLITVGCVETEIPEFFRVFHGACNGDAVALDNYYLSVVRIRHLCRAHYVNHTTDPNISIGELNPVCSSND